MNDLSDHPQVLLTFHIYERKVVDSQAEQFKKVVHHLAEAREWSIRKPAFVDAIIPPFNPQKDNAVRRVEGNLPLFQTLPPWGDKLPVRVNRAQLAEVEDLVDALCRFSLASGVSVALQLDGTDVGRIERGNPDELITVGLIGEWRRYLDALPNE